MTMAVLREFRCIAHDLAFESLEEKPSCPSGCSPKFCVQEFRTPPSIRSGGTRVFDSMQKQLAADYNLTDMRNDKDGSSVMSRTSTESGGTRVVGQQQSKAYWDASRFPVRPGWAQRGEPAPQVDTRQARIMDGGVPIQQIQEGAKNHLRKATQLIRPGAKK
jgi:hypothetical protein